MQTDNMLKDFEDMIELLSSEELIVMYERLALELSIRKQLLRKLRE